ncbi:MAG: LytR/AlgR family response regulator transcription factor [Saprospiraceae bacterium]
MEILKILNQPFPNEHGLARGLRYVTAAAVFVFLFLYIIQPFGMDDYPDSKLALSAGFGLVTFLAGGLYEVITHLLFAIKKDLPTWTLGKWILNTLMMVTFIAVGNYIFQWLMGFVDHFSIWGILGMAFTTLKVAVFPIVFLGTVTYFRSLRANEKVAEEMKIVPVTTLTEKRIQITAANGNIELELAEKDFYYAEAMQNYVSIFYQNGDTFKKHIVRNTLSAIEQQLADSLIIRCHRSYLVNRQAITKIGGNAQGLKLSLRNLTDTIIPVSRKFIPKFR